MEDQVPPIDLKKPKRRFFFVLSRDAFCCACFVYFFLQLVQLAPLNANWFEPASNAFRDFDWSDIYFSQIRNVNDSKAQNRDIVAINVENANREQIANTLFRLKNADVKVVGLDVLFGDRDDSTADALLDSSIRSFGKRIVVACYADSTAGNSIFSMQPLTVPRLDDEDNIGYVNFIGDENTTVRTFYKVQDFREKVIPSFAFNTFIKSRSQSEMTAYKDLMTREETIIPYQSLPEHYTTFSYHDVLDSSIDFGLLRDKIVLLGFCGSPNGANVIDDKHFTPLNKNYAGKAIPDMYGIYIHCNIIEAYLDGYKIHAPPRALQIFVCLLIITFFLLFYLYSESKEHAWQNVVELLLQTIFGFIIIISAIYFLSVSGIKWNIGEMVAAIALAGPLTGIYEIIIHYLGKVYSFESIFLNEE
jgi:CHASE2 domain-containing sensor protein